MAITLTTGVNTYTTLEEADSYFAAAGNLDWAALDDETRKQALVLATQSIDLLYGDKFASVIADEQQALLWPRLAFYDNNGRYVSGLPASLKNAVSEVALMQTQGSDLFPQASNTNNIRSQSIQVGGISLSSESFTISSNEMFDGFNKPERCLAPLFKRPSTNWRIKA